MLHYIICTVHIFGFTCSPSEYLWTAPQRPWPVEVWLQWQDTLRCQGKRAQAVGVVHLSSTPGVFLMFFGLQVQQGNKGQRFLAIG